ncbi:MAG: glucoamylase family protein [Cyclobacteriaceae bacterium]
MYYLKESTIILGLLFLLTLVACNDDDSDNKPELILTSLNIGNESLLEGSVVDVPVSQSIVVSFNLPLDTGSVSQGLVITDEAGNELLLRFNFFNSNKSVTIYPTQPLKTYTEYTISITDAIISLYGDSKNIATSYTFRTVEGLLQLEHIESAGIDLNLNSLIYEIPLDLDIKVSFSGELDPATVTSSNVYVVDSKGFKTNINLDVQGSELHISTEPENLNYWSTYSLVLDTAVAGIGATGFEGFEAAFVTKLDSTLKFPEISDDELLTKVQEQTFKYFWDFGHPTSGLARERNTSGETVTIGGSGFGVMAIIVGIERGFISRAEGIDRLYTIVNFLQGWADRFHGVWPHWLNGTNGNVIPFSGNDDGGDLVETAFMIQGLIAARNYLDDQNTLEAQIITKINTLVDEVEWDWYTQDDQSVLYWHWSPNFGWEKNHKITGWNESLIVYVLAASSTTHTIDPAVYTTGWSRSGSMVNSAGNSYYDYTLPLRNDKGGPLFFAHYSFLGLDPRNLSDQYANYWEQNVNHTMINRAYCIDNPRNYLGYSAQCWGLTASDNYEGYNAHSPDNDKGVITPTAALSSFPYSPEESMEALKHFYYILGDRLWGNYGFYDAFSPKENWTASSYLAIDQGPIIVMIENHRTGLLWDLFMSDPEVEAGLTKLGFTYE